jgi:hypothetical protein
VPARSEVRAGWVDSYEYPDALSPKYITWAGPDGAEPLTTFQAIREGLQGTEALEGP